MIQVETKTLASLSTFVTNYKKSHTTIVTGRHDRGIKVFTDYSERIPGVDAITYAHEGVIPGRIVRSVSFERAPKNETEESTMDILQSLDRIMSSIWIRTSDNSGYGLLVTPSVTGAALGGRSVLLTASQVDHANTGLSVGTFLNACHTLSNEHISDYGWYATTLNLMGERCATFM